MNCEHCYRRSTQTNDDTVKNYCTKKILLSKMNTITRITQIAASVTEGGTGSAEANSSRSNHLFELRCFEAILYRMPRPAHSGRAFSHRP